MYLWHTFILVGMAVAFRLLFCAELALCSTLASLFGEITTSTMVILDSQDMISPVVCKNFSSP